MGITRREFLVDLFLIGGGIVLAACIPTIPEVKPSRLLNPTEQEYIDFAQNRLAPIFKKAYDLRESANGIDLARVSLNDQFKNLPDDEAVSISIKEKAKELRGKSILGLYGGTAEEQADFINYIEAIKQIYNAQGFAVERNLNLPLPSLSIFKPHEKERESIFPLNVSLGEITRYYIDASESSKVIFDTYKLQSEEHGVGESFWYDKEVFIFLDKVQQLSKDLEAVADGESLDASKEPPKDDLKAKAIRETVKRIISSIKTSGGNIAEINKRAIKWHEDVHLIPIFPPTTDVSNEQRSYAAQLYSKFPEIAKISLATFLFIISQKSFIDNAKKYNTSSIVAGLPEVLSDFIEAILVDKNKLNPQISLKMDLEKLLSDQNDLHNQIAGQSKYLPISQYKDDVIFHILTKADRLTGVELNAIAELIFEKHIGDRWLPRVAKPIVSHSPEQSLDRAIYDPPFLPRQVVFQKQYSVAIS